MEIASIRLIRKWDKKCGVERWHARESGKSQRINELDFCFLSSLDILSSRLLRLNQDRYAEEIAHGLHEKGKLKKDAV